MLTTDALIHCLREDDINRAQSPECVPESASTTFPRHCSYYQIHSHHFKAPHYTSCLATTTPETLPTALRRRFRPRLRRVERTLIAEDLHLWTPTSRYDLIISMICVLWSNGFASAISLHKAVMLPLVVSRREVRKPKKPAERVARFRNEL